MSHRVITILNVVILSFFLVYFLPVRTFFFPVPLYIPRLCSPLKWEMGIMLALEPEFARKVKRVLLSCMNRLGKSVFESVPAATTAFLLRFPE